MYQSKQHEHTYIHKHYLIFYIAYVRDGVTNEWRKNGLLAKSSKKTSFSSLKFSRSVMSNSLQPHGLSIPGFPAHHQLLKRSNSCPSSQWCHPVVSSSVIPFFSCLQFSPALGSSPISQFFSLGGQSIGASALASVLPMNIQGWFLLELTKTSLLYIKNKP